MGEWEEGQGREGDEKKGGRWDDGREMGRRGYGKKEGRWEEGREMGRTEGGRREERGEAGEGQGRGSRTIGAGGEVRQLATQGNERAHERQPRISQTKAP